MAKAVETYRGKDIWTFAEQMGFHPYRAEDGFCFISHYRREDDAPCLSFAGSVEECRAEIDDLLEAEAA